MKIQREVVETGEGSTELKALQRASVKALKKMYETRPIIRITFGEEDKNMALSWDEVLKVMPKLYGFYEEEGLAKAPKIFQNIKKVNKLKNPKSYSYELHASKRKVNEATPKFNKKPCILPLNVESRKTENDDMNDDINDDASIEDIMEFETIDELPMEEEDVDQSSEVIKAESSSGDEAATRCVVNEKQEDGEGEMPERTASDIGEVIHEMETDEHFCVKMNEPVKAADRENENAASFAQERRTTLKCEENNSENDEQNDAATTKDDLQKGKSEEKQSASIETQIEATDRRQDVFVCGSKNVATSHKKDANIDIDSVIFKELLTKGDQIKLVITDYLRNNMKYLKDPTCWLVFGPNLQNKMKSSLYAAVIPMGWMINEIMYEGNQYVVIYPLRDWKAIHGLLEAQESHSLRQYQLIDSAKNLASLKFELDL